MCPWVSITGCLIVRHVVSAPCFSAHMPGQEVREKTQCQMALNRGTDPRPKGSKPFVLPLHQSSRYSGEELPQHFSVSVFYQHRCLQSRCGFVRTRLTMEATACGCLCGHFAVTAFAVRLLAPPRSLRLARTVAHS